MIEMIEMMVVQQHAGALQVISFVEPIHKDKDTW